MLSGTLGASLLGNILASKGELTMEIKDMIMKKNGFLILPHLLTNFQMQKFYKFLGHI